MENNISQPVQEKHKILKKKYISRVSFLFSWCGLLYKAAKKKKKIDAFHQSERVDADVIVAYSNTKRWKCFGSLLSSFT